MVNGIESFRQAFSGYPDCYTIIGGTACDILLTERGFDFRATRDIDIILILEDRYPDFIRTFWEYIRTGGYKCGWKNSEDMHFYRFTEPADGYPVQIELFSRQPGYHLEVDEGIIPIHIGEDISSLSAILLSDDFYDFMMSGRRTVDSLTVLGAEYLIPFKMYAWLNLLQKKESGEHVNEKDLRKHRNDVFRLLQIVTVPAVAVANTGAVRECIVSFLNRIENIDIPLEQIGVPLSKESCIDLMQQIYL